MNKDYITTDLIELQKLKTERCYVCSGKDVSCGDYVKGVGYMSCIWNKVIKDDAKRIEDDSKGILTFGYLEQIIKG